MQGSLGNKSFGFALVPDNDRLVSCFSASSRQAIHLSGPAFSDPTLRLRREDSEQPEMQLLQPFGSVTALCPLRLAPPLCFWRLVPPCVSVYSSISTYVDGNQPTLPFTSPLHQPLPLIFV